MVTFQFCLWKMDLTYTEDIEFDRFLLICLWLVLDYGHLIYHLSFSAGMDLVYLVKLMECSSQCGLDWNLHLTICLHLFYWTLCLRSNLVALMIPIYLKVVCNRFLDIVFCFPLTLLLPKLSHSLCLILWLVMLYIHWKLQIELPHSHPSSFYYKQYI